MDLSTTYLGFNLPHPFMPGASPLTDDLDTVRRLEDAGAPMIVLRSLFEEQIEREQRATYDAVHGPAESFAEALTYFPTHINVVFSPDEYLEHIRRVRQAVDVPVVASLNGVTPGGWLRFARLIQDAGADALELNIYDLSIDPTQSADAVEQEIISLVKHVKALVKIPLAVKLSPFYSSLPHLAHRLDEAAADALIVFNRFYQPDINVEELEIQPVLKLSDPSELLLRLRWLAILSGRIQADLAASGGVHTPLDAIKAVMCGAHAVQMVSALLLHGPNHLLQIRQQVAQWLEDHEYESLKQMHASMSLQRCPDPKAFERANYMRILHSWHHS